MCDNVLVQSIIDRIYEFEQDCQPHKASKVILRFIIECERDSNFEDLDLLLKQIDLTKLSMHSISALVRFCALAKHLLPTYPSVLDCAKNLIDRPSLFVGLN